MTHDEFLKQLHDLDTALTERCEVWVVIVDEQRHELQRIFRGYFHDRQPSEREDEI